MDEPPSSGGEWCSFQWAQFCFVSASCPDLLVQRLLPTVAACSTPSLLFSHRSNFNCFVKSWSSSCWDGHGASLQLLQCFSPGPGDRYFSRHVRLVYFSFLLLFFLLGLSCCVSEDVTKLLLWCIGVFILLWFSCNFCSLPLKAVLLDVCHDLFFFVAIIPILADFIQNFSWKYKLLSSTITNIH